jgi:hypothetical protein
VAEISSSSLSIQIHGGGERLEKQSLHPGQQAQNHWDQEERAHAEIPRSSLPTGAKGVTESQTQMVESKAFLSEPPITGESMVI